MYRIPHKAFNYIFIYLILAVVLCVLLLTTSKIESHLLLNGYHCSTLDSFMQYYTYLAEWPLYLVALLPLFFRKWRWTVFYAVSGGVVALLINGLKYCFLAPRPVVYFEQHAVALPVVPGEDLHGYYSFPSGHSCTFFFIATVTALFLAELYTQRQETLKSFFHSKTVQQSIIILLLILAVIGGYSRVYLSQHFLADVFGGSVIGVLVPCIMFFLFGKLIVK